MRTIDLVCAGRRVPDARDQVWRYCGVAWGGDAPESWGYEYFDSVPTGPDDSVGPPDLLAAAALQPGFGRPEMAFFNSGGREACELWLALLPRETDLDDADPQTVAHLSKHPKVAPGRLSLISKVAHHKRPRLVPLFDEAIVDWYRPTTGARGEASWPVLVDAIRTDLKLAENRQFLTSLQDELASEVAGPVPSRLRLVDIGIWMVSRQR